MRFEWNREKNEKLFHERGLQFEIIVAAIEQGFLLDDIENPSVNFPHQRALVVAVDGYAVVVPYLEQNDVLFLKTAFPSRRATRLYLNR